ncbi:hypothetical protein RIF29_28828 [Crotalaria pallida]|uniref:Uncharacterized protein n=1 Tax=Crotalaria pallida TaxID=3830 RepID=A0AAN9EDH6_CROPI
MQKYKHIQDEWVPDSVEDEQSPKVDEDGEEGEVKEAEKKIPNLINAINHFSEEENVGIVNFSGEQCKINGGSGENNVGTAAESPRDANRDTSFQHEVENIGLEDENFVYETIENESFSIGPKETQVQIEKPVTLDLVGEDFDKPLGSGHNEFFDAPHTDTNSEEDSIEDERDANTNAKRRPSQVAGSGGVKSQKQVGPVMKKHVKKRKKKKVKKQNEMIAWKNFWIDLKIDPVKQPLEDLLEVNSLVATINSQRQLSNGTGMQGIHAITPTIGSRSSATNTDMVSDETRSKDSKEAEMLWMTGQQIGVTGHGNDAEILQRMVEMEDRDKEEKRRRSRDLEGDK